MEMEHSMQLSSSAEDGEPAAKNMRQNVPDVCLFYCSTMYSVVGIIRRQNCLLIIGAL